MKAVVKDIPGNTIIDGCHFVSSMVLLIGETIDVVPEPDNQNVWYRQLRGPYCRFHRSWLQFVTHSKRSYRAPKALPKIEIADQTMIAHWPKGKRTGTTCVSDDNFDPFVGLAIVCLKGNYTAGEINRMLLNVKIHTSSRR